MYKSKAKRQYTMYNIFTQIWRGALGTNGQILLFWITMYYKIQFNGTCTLNHGHDLWELTFKLNEGVLLKVLTFVLSAICLIWLNLIFSLFDQNQSNFMK